MQHEAAPFAHERATVDQRGDELFDEERVALRTRKDELLECRLRVAGEGAKQKSRLIGGEWLEPNRLTLDARLRACGRNDEQRRAHIVLDAREQLEEILVRPVDVLDH